MADRMAFPLGGRALAGVVDSEVSVMGAIHRACDERNTFSERVHTLLEETHESAVCHVAKTAPGDMISWLDVELGRLPVPLAGFIWAVVSDPRPPLRMIERGLLWRLSTEGLRALAFGKVQLIEI